MPRSGPTETPQLQSAAMGLLRDRLLDPLEHRAARSASDHARLRSELVVAAIAGIVISRSSGAFPELTSASSADVGALLADLIAAVVD